MGPSITSVRRRQTQMTKDLQRQMEDTIAEYPDAELQTYLLEYLGADELAGQQLLEETGLLPRADEPAGSYPILLAHVLGGRREIYRGEAARLGRRPLHPP